MIGEFLFVMPILSRRLSSHRACCSARLLVIYSASELLGHHRLLLGVPGKGCVVNGIDVAGIRLAIRALGKFRVAKRVDERCGGCVREKEAVVLNVIDV